MNLRERIGEFVRCSTTSGYYEAYVPKNLPPHPALDMGRLCQPLEQATIALGRLDAIGMILPDKELFLCMHARQEAVLSSQIEGTQSSLSDLLLFEIEGVPSVPIDDVHEVLNYVNAMNYGLKRLKELPLSLRLIREIHEKLMLGVRGSNKAPGEFRASQNWIGGSWPGNADFVPPPHIQMMVALDAFEKFLHDETIAMPVLIRAALAHVQFETIHPFLDGNGRIGRLLITLILCAEGILKDPLLYLSLYFKSNQKDYYKHLQSVRETGDWEAWIEFFLLGVRDTAAQATDTMQAIQNLFEENQRNLEKSKPSATVVNIHHHFQRYPISNTKEIKKMYDLSSPTISRALRTLEQVGIIKEITGKDRHKIFVYRECLNILNKGIENLSH